MARYRKKPVEIEAVQWTPGYHYGSPRWLVEAFESSKVVHPVTIDKLLIKTLEGLMTAEPGDWIIRGVKGEIYPCKPDIFDLTYDLVLDDNSGTS